MKRLTTAGLLCCLLLAGCATWILPPGGPDDRRQQINIAEPDAPMKRSTGPHFPHRTDVVIGVRDRHAEVKMRFMPNIPLAMEAAAEKIEIYFIVEADGTVKDVKLVASSGNAELDALYLGAVRTWSYTPAVTDGRPTPEIVGQVFIIKLQK